ncbi:DUF3471 domain-containing protein [Candidatus Poribacteria bacterium]
MKRCLMIILVAQMFLTGSIVVACTVFYASDGEMVLAGNNEDGSNPNTKVLFLPPEEGKYGRVYFEYDNFVPQGGVNDQGLFFDHTATGPLDVVLSKDKESPRRNLIHEVIETCATVEEALKVYDKYNLQFMQKFQTIFGDKTGDSAIIEGDVIIRKQGKYQILTNFHQSKVESGKYPCERYKIAVEMLENADDISVDLFRRILAAVHQEGSKTLYSNIYDLKRGIIYLYHFHNYENVVEIDLKEELKKGKQTHDLPSLFPRTFAAEAYDRNWVKELEKKKEELEERKAAKHNPNVDPEIYEAYVGQYTISSAGLSRTITIMQEEDNLYYKVDSQKIELLPESENRFFHMFLQVSWRAFFREVTVTFLKDETGKVNELEIILVDGRKISAKRT